MIYKVRWCSLFLLSSQPGAVGIFVRQIVALLSRLEALHLKQTLELPHFEDNLPSIPEEVELRLQFDSALTMLQRYTGKVAESLLQSAWFALLDALVEPLNRHKPSKEPAISSSRNGSRLLRYRRVLLSHIRRALEAMVGHVALASLIQRLITDHSDSTVGDFRSIFLALVEGSSYEQATLVEMTQLLAHEEFNRLQQLYVARHLPVAPTGETVDKVNWGWKRLKSREEIEFDRNGMSFEYSMIHPDLAGEILAPHPINRLSKQAARRPGTDSIPVQRLPHWTSDALVRFPCFLLTPTASTGSRPPRVPIRTQFCCGGGQSKSGPIILWREPPA